MRTPYFLSWKILRSKRNTHMWAFLTRVCTVGNDVTIHGSDGWLPEQQSLRVSDVDCSQPARLIQSCDHTQYTSEHKYTKEHKLLCSSYWNVWLKYHSLSKASKLVVIADIKYLFKAPLMNSIHDPTTSLDLHSGVRGFGSSFLFILRFRLLCFYFTLDYHCSTLNSLYVQEFLVNICVAFLFFLQHL